MQKNQLREFFNYSRKEIRGIVVLIILIILLIFIRIISEKKSERTFHLVYDTIAVDEDESAFTGRSHTDSGLGKASKQVIVNKCSGIFDPNDAPFEVLLQYGFSKKISANIIKYRTKGGVFRKADDLLKIYGIDTSLVRSLRTSVVIHSKKKIEAKMPKKVLTFSYETRLEINGADSSKLIALKGIGTTISRRILKYRLLIGGFYELSQLKEVYGISDSILAIIQPQLFADTSRIVKINLNTCSFYELKRHPYVGSYAAKNIMNFRRLIGAIDSIQQLADNHILTKENLTRLSPYIKLK